MKEPPRREELKALAALGGMSTSGLLNPRSRVLKGSGVDPEKVTPDEAAALIEQNPRVLYRPLLTDGRGLVLGFHPEEMERLLRLQQKE